MTGQQVFDAWNDPEITDIYEAAVLMAIADEADERGFSRPRIEDICRKARCKKRSVEIQIKALKEKGKITVTTRKGTSNEYQILGRTTCAPTRAPHAPLPAHDVHLLPAPNAPHSISALSIKDSSIKDLSVSNETQDEPLKAIGTFDPDEPEINPKTKKVRNKGLPPGTMIEKKFFGLLAEEYKATYGNSKGPLYWPSASCRQKFLTTINRIGEDNLIPSLKRAFETGNIRLVQAVNFISSTPKYKKPSYTKPMPPQERLSPEEAKAFRERHQKIVEAGKNQ
jgi:hypothetical protein